MRSVLDQYAAAIYMSTGAVCPPSANFYVRGSLTLRIKCLFGVTDIFVKLLVDDADQPAVSSLCSPFAGSFSIPNFPGLYSANKNGPYDAGLLGLHVLPGLRECDRWPS